MTDAPILVADIGGTRARVALARDGQVLRRTVWTGRVADHEDPAALIRGFLGQCGLSPARAVLAVAGPVGKGRARLTNGDWCFDTDDLGLELGMPAHLVNDLVALGHAVPVLRADQARWLTGAPPHPPRQALVIGVGTGFNLCPVVIEGETAHVVACEYGHMSLPVSVSHALDRAAMTIEDAFSGREYESLGDPERFARAFGVLLREVCRAFQPDAVYLAGGVARTVLDGTARGACLDAVQDQAMALVTDDAAALSGCARL